MERYERTKINEGELRVESHESWNFPAGVSFALKQNMYWGGFGAFLPDISGLGGGGVCFLFLVFWGTP